MPIDIKKLSSSFLVKPISEEDFPAVLKLYESNPQYFLHMKETATLDSVREDFSCRPEGKEPEDKYFVGYWDGKALTAVMELIDGYPDAETAFIGLFMMNAERQRRGTGSLIVNEAIDFFASSGFKRVKLGYVVGNEQSEHFWLKNGFLPTGVTSECKGYAVASMQREL